VDQRSQKTDGVASQGPIAGAVRPRYREGQLLRAADLTAEQAYQIAMRRRHNIGGHGWGIVRGLALEVLGAPPDRKVVLQPGLAVDGYGRELIVTAQVILPLAEFSDAVAVDAWLLYSRTAETTSQSGRWDCAPGQNNRWREDAVLRLVRLDSVNDKIDPRHPIEVSEDDADFSPHETPSDDLGREWPVHLGRVACEDGSYSINPDLRPYAALAGDKVIAPSGQAQMLVGGETAKDHRRFAISARGSDGELADKLTIDIEGKATIHGDTAVISSSVGPGKRLLAEAHIRFDQLAAPPEAPAPWQVYRVATEKDGKKLNQLRFEIAHPGKKDDPTIYQFVVGVRDKGSFKACLVVQADCTVRIAKDATLALAPDSRVIEGPIQPDPDDPRFIKALQGQWSNALIGNAGNLLGMLQIVLFKSQADAMEGVPFECKFTVFNPGQAGVTNVTPLVKLTFINSEGKEEDVEVKSINPTGFPLGAGASKEISVKSGDLPITHVLGNTLRINIVAIGSGLTGNPLFDLLDLVLPVTAIVIN
jgi:hypothetical protein